MKKRNMGIERRKVSRASEADPRAFLDQSDQLIGAFPPMPPLSAEILYPFAYMLSSNKKGNP